MIRLPPTSVSLSINDMKSHLQQIDVYHGLLQQGFKKRDISKYFREHRAFLHGESESSDSDISMRASAWTDLTLLAAKPDSSICGHLNAKGLDILQNSDSSLTDKGNDAAGIRHTASVASSPCVGSSTASSSPSFESDQYQTQFYQRTSSAESASKHHVPRRSSLLRFSKNASPTEEECQASPFLIPFSSRSTIKYKVRTETHSYERSSSEQELSSSSLVDVFSDLALDESLVLDKTPAKKRSQLRGDAEEFTPLALPCPLSATARARCLSSGLWSVRHDEPLLAASAASLTSGIVPALQTEQEVDDYSIFSDLPNSPFAVLDTPSFDTLLTSASQESSSPPSTPAPRRFHRTQTEPRRHGHRNLDGPSFVPYNDSLPASLQPQTPADLSRGPLVSEFTAAYTAPPGRLRESGHSSWQADSRETDFREQSPTTRAIGIRQRRNREFARSTRVESLRIHRTRRRPRVEREEEREIESEAQEFWFDGGHNNLWRDDLDADRVGEENFEVLQEPDPPVTEMRVVSGNRRAPGI